MPRKITIRKADGTWVIRAGGAVLGESRNALELTEGDMAPVIYFPQGDIAMAFLEPAEARATSPYLGDARYYSIQSKSQLIENAAWSYDVPKEAAAGIAGHLAFDKDKVAIEQF